MTTLKLYSRCRDTAAIGTRRAGVLRIGCRQSALQAAGAAAARTTTVCYLQEILRNLSGYDSKHLKNLEIAVIEALGWLENQLYLVPTPGVRGAGGVPMLTLGRRAKALKDDETQWKALRAAAAFAKELLHASVAGRAWISIMRNEFDAAVLFSFKEVEVAVRAAAGFPSTEFGVALMRKAFNPDSGPLTRSTDPPAEREALMRLFAGAIGSYKNPHSHRNVVLTDPAEAQEMVMLASHLLRIVDARRPAP